MQVNTINNSNFGARFMDTPGTQRALAKLKETCISRGLSPQLYEREFAKIHKIFPSDDVVIALNPTTYLCDVAIGIKYPNKPNFEYEYVEGGTTVDAPFKYLVAKVISACKKIAERMAEK